MKIKDPNVLITGAAGFIGSQLALKFLQNGNNVMGIDNLNDYYSVELKKTRLSNILEKSKNYSGKWNFKKVSLENYSDLKIIFSKFVPDIVVNLAAQAGVRYSIENPFSYIQSNIVGFTNLLECCRKYEVSNLVYASSSSVYGGNKNLPYNEKQGVNHPVSLYAATKKSNELIAHSYSHLYKIPAIGLRYFTVYGPWGRPDMAPMIFAKSILESKKISIFNYGKMQRDFTYIEDIVEGTFRCCFKPAKPSTKFDHLSPNPAVSFAPHMLFNIGNSKPIELMYFIELLEKSLGARAIKDFQPLQPGDVLSTAADTKSLENWIQFTPKTSIESGVDKFIKWFKFYYKY